MDGEITPSFTAFVGPSRHHDSHREFKIKGAAHQTDTSWHARPLAQDCNNIVVGNDFDVIAKTSHSTNNHKPSDTLHIDCCTICLEPISERAVASPCNHLTFDFICLVSWLQGHSTCPLCKAEVKEVQYEWCSPTDFKTYTVTKPETHQQRQSSGADASFSRHRSSQQWRRHLHIRSDEPGHRLPIHQSIDNGLQRRREVYRNRTPSLYVGANRISQYRDFTAETFSKSADLQSRARAFLRRELRVFTFLDNDGNSSARGNSREFLVEYILAILRTNELKGAGGEAENLVAEFLGRENGRLVLHELEAWLRSPYTGLEAWDKHVQYALRRA
ncbi:hypothetical protein K431DRAFT_288758 [Polychaeton citri CBS 116435]|uniref:RING-type E3 ubiquitin transferase n=1 Tax=Polychaeton citri CBS 116435 TaxID=1314669 RepID=A0A9P4Q0H9_9PEZI|nr:hypothetical protein K431DRAFT_288758 [Polychaeton citri CBS 116435]